MKAYLLGFRAAGKTTLGAAAAEKAGWYFLDLDQEWEKRAGRTILSFVEEKGVGAFRAEEAKLLQEVEARPDDRLLVATGGGVLEGEASRGILSASRHPKILLSVDAETLWRRLEGAPERRKIGELTSQEAMRVLLEKRLTQYEKIATYTVENRDITQSLAELSRLLRTL